MRLNEASTPGPAISPFHHRIGMLLTEQTDGIAGAVDDDGKEIENVAAENAHVESLQIGEGRKLPVESIFVASSSMRRI
jgi:hypothetical protein